MNISFLGGACEVGGSCILLKINDKNILLDCGIRQGSAKDPIPDFKIIQENGGVDAIIISHAHMDHIGCLPIISKEYPMAKIYTNIMTKDLMQVLLHDSLKIMNNRESEIPLYAEKDVREMLERVVPINYMVEFSIFNNIKICFYNAGHIAGASCVYIKSSEGSLFYSGDFSLFSQRTVEGLKLPKLRPDIGIFETTYGDRLHSNREVEEQRLIDIIKECIENNGKMLIPAFALGRAQEVILTIKKAINKGIIHDIKIYVDGMIRNINKVYKFNPTYLKNSLGEKILRGIEPFYDDNIICVEDKKSREKIMKSKNSCIIISSSGMLTGGFSQYYAGKLAPLEKNYIVITGYQDEESPGRKLLSLLDKSDTNKKIEINGKMVPVRCRVENIGLSAHSDKEEIKSLIKMLCPRSIFMVHGNENVVRNFSRGISLETISKVYSPKCGESYEVNINRPRKQWIRKIDKTLGQDSILNQENIDKLWEFTIKNYGQKFFTIEELVYIWSGYKKYIFEFQQCIINSVYFENDMKRLFLFKAKSRDEVEESLKPRELKPNELNDLIKRYFKKFKFKKASLIYDEKKVVLSFDFPSVVDKKIYKIIEEFEQNNNWKIDISNSININEASRIIREIFYNADIKKISYRLEKNCVEVNLNSNFHVNNDILHKFTKYTGLVIAVNSPDFNANTTINHDIIKCDRDNNRMEQNKALNFIENEFKDREFKPYKKSIKTYQNEKYIELVFITPSIGKQYRHTIDKLVETTGWNMKISNNINQNAIINKANLLCSMNNIALKKNPSFNISNLTLSLKLEEIQNDEILQNIKKEFEYSTGCSLLFDS